MSSRPLPMRLLGAITFTSLIGAALLLKSCVSATDQNNTTKTTEDFSDPGCPIGTDDMYRLHAHLDAAHAPGDDIYPVWEDDLVGCVDGCFKERSFSMCLTGCQDKHVPTHVSISAKP